MFQLIKNSSEMFSIVIRPNKRLMFKSTAWIFGNKYGVTDST